MAKGNHRPALRWEVTFRRKWGSRGGAQSRAEWDAPVSVVCAEGRSLASDLSPSRRALADGDYRRGHGPSQRFRATAKRSLEDHQGGAKAV
jgi:hypothetical protein